MTIKTALSTANIVLTPSAMTAISSSICPFSFLFPNIEYSTSSKKISATYAPDSTIVTMLISKTIAEMIIAISILFAFILPEPSIAISVYNA